MRVTLRPDPHTGMTGPQMLAMVDRLRLRETSLRESATTATPAESKVLLRDADTIRQDVPVWEAAAHQLSTTEGRWAIDWSAPVDVAEAAADSILREYGARNSKKDQSTIQAAHDTLCGLGAVCGMKDGGAPAGEVRESVVVMNGDSVDIRFAEAGTLDGYVTLREAGAEFNDADRTLWITPIRPGFGNKRDGFYYPVETVREAVTSGQFDGAKMFANHPRRTDEKELPERSVNDWVGVIKETRWDDTRGVPRAKVKVLREEVYNLWKEAPEHVAFSVLGSGVARPGRVNGQTARIVESVKGIRSVDWVTQAGAGGGIDFAESATEESDMDLSSITVDQFREALAARPDLLSVLREADEPERVEAPAEPETPDATAVDDDDGETDGEGETNGDPGTDVVPEPAGEPAPEGYVSREDYDALAARITAMEVHEAYTSGTAAAADVVESVLSATTLPRAAREYITRTFAEAAVGRGMDYPDEETLREAVEGEVEQMGIIVGRPTRPSLVTGLGTATDTVAQPSSLREAMEGSLLNRVQRSDDLPSAELAESGSLAGTPSASAAGRNVESRMSQRGI